MTARTKSKILFLMMPALLAACGGLTSKEPPPAMYILHPATAAGSPVSEKAAQVMIVPEPEVPQGFKTDQIALFMQGGRRLDYFAGAKWPADLDRVLQDFIIQSLRHSWPHAIVASPDAGMPASWKLLVKVADFQPVYKGGADGAPEIHITMAFTLIALPDGKIVSDFTLEKKAAAPGNSLTAITAEMESLLRNMLREAGRKISLPPPRTEKQSDADSKKNPDTAGKQATP